MFITAKVWNRYENIVDKVFKYNVALQIANYKTLRIMNNNSSKDVDVNIGQIDKKGSKMSKTHSRNVEILDLKSIDMMVYSQHDGVQPVKYK